MSDVIYKKIGGMNLCIIINNTFYEEFIHKFLIYNTTNSIDVQCKIKISFIEKKQKEPKLDLEMYSKIELMNACYYYNRNLEEYYVEGFGFSGNINVVKQEVHWFVYEMIEPRSLFHLLILDPVSLISPYYDLLIGHGAVIRENNEVHVIFGQSGAGKSTISRLISNQYEDMNKISDDTFAFSIEGETIKVIPFNTGEGYIKSALNINIEEIENKKNRMIIENEKKVYVIDEPDSITNSLRLRKSYFLKKDISVKDTEITELNITGHLKALLEFHTSIPSLYTKKKFMLWKLVSNYSHGYLIRYKKLCNIKKLGEVMRWNHEK
ncbi:hypothetical protein ACFVQB_12125 [Paenibacillus sp. NPDC057886]|uniref:hypothetical protein n=1 Tax=Paenibacillus sp. NPDC057886 TaxID=3346270 RepID=UPI0036926914